MDINIAIARRDQGDSPYVTFPMRCFEGDANCALPIGHLCDHIGIEQAWDDPRP